MNGILRVPRRAALATIAVLIAAASLTSFAESYRGLYDWSHEHGLSGLWAVIWPLQVDVFIAVGELALFVALADRWAPRSRLAAWAVTACGLAVSVAGNVGHVTGHSLASRATAAIPPLAAAAALAVGLGVLKRVVEAHHATGQKRAQQVTTERPERVATDRPARVATTRPRKRPKRVATKRPAAADTEAAIMTALATDPGMTNADLAIAAGTSERTARRYRRPLEAVGAGVATEVATQ